MVLGEVVKPHGIRGEICVLSHADSPSIFGAAGHVLLTGGGKPVRRKVVAWREHKDRVLLSLAGVTSRDEAEELRGRSVCLRREDMPEPDDGQVYLHDILGYTVVLEDGTELGPFTRFIDTAGAEVWIVEHPRGEIMLPAVDEVVLDIDAERRVITVNPPEGLVDLYINPPASKNKKKGKARS